MEDNLELGAYLRYKSSEKHANIRQDMERIFKLFQTLTRRDDCESTGVGLTVAKKIVELYGGKIWLESEVGQGTTFFFTLPQQSPKAAEEALEPCVAEA